MFARAVSFLQRNFQRPPHDIIKIALLILLIILIFATAAGINFNTSNSQQYSHLAYSFLQGKLNLADNLPFFDAPELTLDGVPFNGLYYWALGLFPALVLIPWVFLFSLGHLVFLQGYLSFFIALAVFVLCFRLSRRLKFSRSDSLFLAAAFCFASMFIEMVFVSTSWKFAQTIATFLILLSIYEYLGKRRWWLIGIIFGCVFLTRATAGLGIVFFILAATFLIKSWSSKIKSLVWLLIPFFLVCSLALFYNYARFGNVWETGYSLATLGDPMHPKEEFVEAREAGLFSLAHLPGNLYYAFIATPQPVFQEPGSPILKYPYLTYDGWGLSIFLTSPYLFYLLFHRIRGRIFWILLATIIAVAIPIFLFFGIGYHQFGYRYALDFFPFLFLTLLLTLQHYEKKLSLVLQVIILCSLAFNFYLLLA